MPSVRGWKAAPDAASGLEDCSLVVPTYRRPREVGLLLETIGRAAADDRPGEIVVVDGSPDDVVEEAVRKWYGAGRPGFTLSYIRSRPGLTRQKNAGIDVSTREIVFFLDDDTIPQPGYFREIRKAFRKDGAEKLGAVAGSIVNEMDRPVTRRWRIRIAVGLAPRVAPMYYDPSGTSTPMGLMKQFTGVRRVEIVPGGASAFRRRVFERNRFSEFFDGYSQGEDLEMSLRIGKEWELACCGDAHVLHCPAPGGRPPSFIKGRMEVLNRYFIRRRHAARLSPGHELRFWLDVGFLISMDAAWFLAKPWRPRVLLHALGLVAGSAECVLFPPRFDEPPAGRRYLAEWTTARGA